MTDRQGRLFEKRNIFEGRAGIRGKSCSPAMDLRG